MNIHALLVSRFSEALDKLGAENAPVPVARSSRPEFGEYQFNGAMALAKQLRQKPLTAHLKKWPISQRKSLSW